MLSSLLIISATLAAGFEDCQTIFSQYKLKCGQIANYSSSSCIDRAVGLLNACISEADAMINTGSSDPVSPTGAASSPENTGALLTHSYNTVSSPAAATLSTINPVITPINPPAVTTLPGSESTSSSSAPEPTSDKSVNLDSPATQLAPVLVFQSGDYKIQTGGNAGCFGVDDSHPLESVVSITPGFELRFYTEYGCAKNSEVGNNDSFPLPNVKSIEIIAASSY